MPAAGQLLTTLASAEDRHAEPPLDDADSIALHQTARRALSRSAVHGAEAHNVIHSVRRTLNAR